MTDFAKFTRMLRVESDERLGHMAKKLGVSSAFLSRVENGLAKPSEKILTGLYQNYSLSDKQKERLKKIFDEAREKNPLEIFKLSPQNHQLVLRLAQSIEKFDDEELIELEERISEKETEAK